MKNIKYFLMLLSSVAFLAGCNKEVEEQRVDTKENVTVKFYAEVNDAETKVTLSPDENERIFHSEWEEGDIMQIEALSEAADYAEGGIATWNGANFDTNLPKSEVTGDWSYDAYYPAQSDIAFGSERSQSENTYTPEYDVMIGSVAYENTTLGKNDQGGNMVIPMTRLTSILYFHLTSNLDEDITSATLTVEGGNIAATKTAISNGKLNVTEGGSNTITLTFPEGKAPNAQDFCLWFNMLPVKATSLSLTVTTASKTMTLNNTKGKEYAAGKINKIVKSGLTWNEALADAVFFEERFTKSTGTMGWSGSVANGDFVADNENWTTSNEYGAGGSAKFGTSSKLGSAKTPSITIGSDYAEEDILLSFKAGAWSGSSESTNLKISATGASIVNDSNTAVSSVTMEKGAWTAYTFHLKNIESPITIKFEGNSASNSRFFLDDVLVYYGEKPALSSLAVLPSEDRNVTYKAGSLDYTVVYTVDEVASTDWSVATSSYGFSVTKTANGFTVSYSQNNGAERSGEIVVTAGSKSQTVKIIQAEKSLTDELTARKIGVSSYSNWSNVSDVTGVTYAGNSTKTSDNEIQLRATNSSGIVSTSTIGSIKKVVVDWGTSLTTERTLDIYGSNTAYESSADLYDNSKRGTMLGSLTYTSADANETEFTVDGTYAYVGVRSNDGALYLNCIKFTYEEDNRQDPGMRWTAASASAMISNSGVSFRAPTLDPGNATGITYASTVPTVASVDASTGTVSVLAEGTTKIQAIFAGDATYKAVTKEYTLTVTDDRTYAITITQPAEGGSISANPNGSQKAGMEITLTADANEGYELDSWKVYKTGDESTKVTVNGDTFEMPAYPVTVTAIFKESQSGGVTPQKVTLKYSGNTTTNMTGGNDAVTVGLDNSKWSVVGAKGGNNNFPGLNKAGDIRLYASSTGTGNGNTITVTTLESGATINSITISFKQGADGAIVLVDGEAVTGTNGNYSINNSSFVIKNSYTAQVQINSIEITYTPAN